MQQSSSALQFSPRLIRWLKSACLTCIFVLAAIVIIGPVYWLLVASGKGLPDLFNSSTFVPGPKIDYAQNLESTFSFGGGLFGKWLINSFAYSTISAALGVYFAGMTGYLVAFFRFRGHRLLLASIVGSLAVPATALVIPTFVLEASLHLTNSYIGVILPMSVYPIGAFFMYAYARGAIPESLLDAARLDGAGELRIFHKIALRLMLPGMATLFLLAFVGAWNNYFLPLVLLNKPSLYPSTLGLATWAGELTTPGIGAPPYRELLLGSVISFLPMLVLFPFLQRFVVKGLSSGALIGE